MKERIVLIGGGGHCKVVIDAIRNADIFDIEGIVDRGLQKNTHVLGIPVLGSDEELPRFFKEGIKYAFIAVGSIGNCEIRKKIYENLKNIGFKLPVIIHPKAVVSSDVNIGDGTFIAAGAVINPVTVIGNNTIINTSSSVDHDCQIGDFVHISPGVTLCGGVKVGDETHIGAGAIVVQCIEIGKKCMISAGLVVRRNLSDNSRERHKFAQPDESE